MVTVARIIFAFVSATTKLLPTFAKRVTKSQAIDSVASLVVANDTQEVVANDTQPVRFPFCLSGFSNIDDTMYALHLWKGPVITYTDQRFKPYTEYAGVRAFYKALAGEYTDSCEFRKVHILSARNEIVVRTAEKLEDILGEGYNFMDGSKDWTPGADPHYYVKGAYEKSGKEGVYVVSKSKAIKGIFLGGDLLDRNKFAEVKFESFRAYVEINILATPSKYNHDREKDIIVWNGDNGQGDMCAAQRMMNFVEKAELKMLAFIHKVSLYSEHKCDELVPPSFSFDKLVNAKKIIYYWTYPDLVANLVSPDGTFYGQILPGNAYDKVIAEATLPPTGTGTGSQPVESFGVPQCQKLFRSCRVSRVRKVYKCGAKHNPVSNGNERKLHYCKKLQGALPDGGEDWPRIFREASK